MQLASGPACVQCAASIGPGSSLLVTASHRNSALQAQCMSSSSAHQVPQVSTLNIGKRRDFETHCQLQPSGFKQLPSRHQMWRRTQQLQMLSVQCSSSAMTQAPDMLADLKAPKRRYSSFGCGCQHKACTWASQRLQDLMAYTSPCRRLIIMRHADSTERGEQQLKDVERTITELGRQAATQVRRLLIELSTVYLLMYYITTRVKIRQCWL